MKKYEYKLFTAESCTGGLLAHIFSTVPGASAVLDRGVTVYSDESKIALLNVSRACIDKFTSVSEEVALEMLRGLVNFSERTIAVSITGELGPISATGISVGTVFIAIAIGEKVSTHKLLLQKGMARNEAQILVTGNCIDIITGVFSIPGE